MATFFVLSPVQTVWQTVPRLPEPSLRPCLVVNTCGHQAAPRARALPQSWAWCSASAVILKQWNLLEDRATNPHALHCLSSQLLKLLRFSPSPQLILMAISLPDTATRYPKTPWAASVPCFETVASWQFLEPENSASHGPGGLFLQWSSGNAIWSREGGFTNCHTLHSLSS
jgi:hypothetical protein